MLDDESGLSELLRDFSKLPGRDRRKISQHLSGRDKMLMKELTSKKSESIKPVDVEYEECLITDDEQSEQLDLSYYSPWLRERLENVLHGDVLQLNSTVTEVGKRAILRSVKKHQDLFPSESLPEAGSKRSIHNLYGKWGRRKGG